VSEDTGFLLILQETQYESKRGWIKMLVHDRSTRTERAKEPTGYWRELLFWMLLLPAFAALESIRPRRQVVGLVEACAFLLVAISSTGKLKSLGLEFANWNRICRRAVAACIGAGLLAGGSIVAVARLSQQPLGTGSGWNRAILAITLGPVLEEVIFRGYLLTAALLLSRHFSLSDSGSAVCSIVATAAIFSIAHLTTAGTTALQLSCIGLTGGLYGWLRLRNGSTAAAALAHAAYNLALYLSYWCGISR
jgi:membrane protease YdiL (CAAX protease family)